MSLAVIADHVASKGRGPDSMLIHMSPSEVHGLQALAQMHGGSLTINPETGLPEAGWLDKLLPAVIGFAINTFAPGVGTAIGETLMGAGAAGAGAVGTGLLVGGAQAVRTGSLAEGISAGLGAYGGANLAGSLAGTGGNILATTEAAKLAGDEAVRNGLAQGLSGAELEAAKAAAIDEAASSTAKVASDASPWDKVSKGFEAAKDNPQSALRANAKNLMYAAGPAIMAGAAVQNKMPQTVTQTGTIRPYSYDPYSGQYTAYDPYQYTPPTKAADGGLMGFGESSNAPITRRNIENMQNTDGMFNYAQDGGGVMKMAHGGLAALAFADGGTPEFTVGGGGGGGANDPYLGFGSKEAYDRAMAYNKSTADAAQAKLDAFQIAPGSRFYEYTQDPSLIPHFHNESDADALLRVKKNAMDYAEQLAGRSSYSTAFPNAAFVAVNGGLKDANGNEVVPGPDDVPGMVMQMKDGTARYVTKDEAANENKARQQWMQDNGYVANTPNFVTGGGGPSNAPAAGNTPNFVTGGGGPSNASAANAPAASTNTPSAAQQYKDQHLVDPTTGHLVNPTLTPEQLRQMRDGINTNNEMRQAYDSYWNTVKPGDVLDFAGGTLTMNNDGTSTHTYTDAQGKRQSYTFNKGTDFATVAKADPNIAAEWKSMFNYTIPSGGGGGGTTTSPSATVQPNIPNQPAGGFTGMNDVRNVYTAGGGSLGYTPYVPTSIADFDAKYNKLTGGSKQSYDYLSGNAEYSPTPYTKTGEIMKPYAESVLGLPSDPTTKKYLFDPATKQYKLNPAYVPPKYTTNAAATATSSTSELTNPAKKPSTDPGTGKQWQWDDATGKWEAAQVAAHGGLLALAGGGMSNQYNLGGYSDGGRLLRGPGDGVSDSIPATIGNRQPAKLADGEFVVPARIVSELGNGSTEAGARKLYAMMDRVQSARRHSIGKGNVAKNSRADKHLPA